MVRGHGQPPALTVSGRASVFSLTQPSLVTLLLAAEELLAATGDAVALCPTYGTAPGAGATAPGAGA